MGSPDSLAKAWPGLRRTVGRFRPHIVAERKLLILGTLALFAAAAMQLLEPWPLAFVLDAIVRRPADWPAVGRWPASTASAAWWSSARSRWSSSWCCGRWPRT